jgi:hypothetical protein
VCDICSASGEGVIVGPEQIKEAVFKKKFDPFKLGLALGTGIYREHGPGAYEYWKTHIVAPDITNWNICPNCWKHLKKYITGKPKADGFDGILFVDEGVGEAMRPAVEQRYASQAVFSTQTAVLFYIVLTLAGLLTGFLCPGLLPGIIAGLLVVYWQKPDPKLAIRQAAIAGAVASLGSLITWTAVTLISMPQSGESIYVLFQAIIWGLSALVTVGVAIGISFLILKTKATSPQTSMPVSSAAAASGDNINSPTATNRIQNAPEPSYESLSYEPLTVELRKIDGQQIIGVELVCSKCKEKLFIPKQDFPSGLPDARTAPKQSGDVMIRFSGQYVRLLTPEAQKRAIPIAMAVIVFLFSLMGGIDPIMSCSLAIGFGLLGYSFLGKIFLEYLLGYVFSKKSPVWLVSCPYCQHSVPIVRREEQYLQAKDAIPTDSVTGQIL